MKRLSIFLTAMLCVIGFSYGQNKMSNDLRNAISNSQNNQKIGVIITMNDQFDVCPLEKATLNMSVKERRAFLINEMKQFSERSQKNLLDILKLSGAENLESHWIFNGISCKVNPNAIYELNNYRGISCLELDNDFSASNLQIEEEPSNDRGTSLWNVAKINADKVWKFNGSTGYTGQGVLIGIIDSGCKVTHNDIANNLWNDGNNHYGFNSVVPTRPYDLTDGFGQGTSVAGVVAGDGTSGQQTGIAKGAKVMILKSSNSNGYTNETYITRGLQNAIDHQVDVIAMTIGESVVGGRASYRVIMENLLSLNIPVAAAGGDNAFTNNIPDNIMSPADCPSPWHNPDESINGGRSALICVGSTDDSDYKAASSSIGPASWASGNYNDYPYTAGSSTQTGLIRPDIAAPGVYVTSLLFSKDNSAYSRCSGTAIAAAHVAGVMALLLEADPTLTPTQLDSIIELSAVPCSGLTNKNNFYGAGRIDAYEAMCMLKNGINAPTNLHGTANQYTINLTWTGSSNAVSYDIYCNEERIASNVTSTNYTYDTDFGGLHTFYVKANKADGKQSARSKSTNVVVNPVGPLVEDLTAIVYGESDTVHLQWQAPSSDLSILEYADAHSLNKQKGNDGYNKQSMTYWAQRYPASLLTTYAGAQITSVNIFFKNTGTGFRLTLYKGNPNGCNEEITHKDFNPTTGWNTITLNSPITIDHTQDLWVVARAPKSVAYPAAYCQNNNPNGLSALISSDGKDWVNQGDNRSWMISMQLAIGNYTYNVQCDGHNVATNLNTTHFDHLHVAPGTHDYTVTTNYNGLVSFPCAPVTVAVQTHYTVTFNPGNGSCSVESLIESGTNSGIVLPTATPCETCLSEGYTFVGWTTAPVSETQEMPTLYYAGDTYHPTHSMTLYAVYSCTIGDASWNRARTIKAGDQVCIVAPTIQYEMTGLDINTGTGYGMQYFSTLYHTYPLTVVDAGDGEYAFLNSAGKYLCNSGEGFLSHKNAIDKSSSWTIDYINDFAIVRNYNFSYAVEMGAKLIEEEAYFSCYGPASPNVLNIVFYRYDDNTTTTYAHEPVCGIYVKTPTITPRPDGIYYQSFTVYASCVTEGAIIRYTTDGTEPTSSSPLYTDAGITVSENGNVIKVKAFKEGMEPSATATYTYQFPVIFDNIAAFKAANNTIDICKINSNMQVSFRKDQTSQDIYVCDETGGLLIHDDHHLVSEDLETFDQITGIQGRFTVRNSQPMLIPTFAINDGPQGAPVVPWTVTVQNINSNYLNYDAMLVKIEEILFDESIELDSSINHVVYDTLSSWQDSIFIHTDTVPTKDSTLICGPMEIIEYEYIINPEDPDDTLEIIAHNVTIPDTCIYNVYDTIRIDSTFSYFMAYDIHTSYVYDYFYNNDTMSFKQDESPYLATNQFKTINRAINNDYYYDVVGLIGVHNGEKMIYPRDNEDIRRYHNISYLDNLEHGSVSTEKDHASYLFPVVVIDSPEPGYHVSYLYYYTTNPTDVTPIDLTTKTFEMPDTDVTIGATFEEDVYYTITFNAGTGICEVESLTEQSYQSGVVLPNAEPSSYCLAAGYNFAGWADHDVTETMVRPELYEAGSIFHLTENTTLYAVYSLGNNSWTEITNGNEVIEGEYIISAKRGSNYYILKHNGVEDDSPTALQTTLTINNVPKDSTQLWTVESIGNDQYTISYSDGAQRYYLTVVMDVSSGIRVVTEEQTTGWKFSQNSTFGLMIQYVWPAKSTRYLGLKYVSKYASRWYSYTTSLYDKDSKIHMFLSPSNTYISSPQCEPDIMAPEFQNIPEGVILEDNYMVTITCGTPDATIYYTIDGSEPDNTSNVYTESFAISETATVKAIAYNNEGISSDVAEQTYTFARRFENIAAFKEAYSSTSQEIARITGDVTYVFRSGRYIYVCDETAGLLIMDKTTSVITNTYEDGDIIPGGVTGTFSKTSGQARMVPTINPAAGIPGTPVEPLSATTFGIISNYNAYDARLVTIEDGYFTDDFDFGTNGQFSFKQGTNSIKAYDQLNTTDLAGEANVRYDLTGFVAMISSSVQGLYPRSNADFVRYYTITCEEGLEGGNISTTSDHARANDVITLNATPDAGYQLAGWTVTDADGETVEVNGSTFIMPAIDVNVTANFEQIEYEIIIEVTPEGAGTVEGAGTYHYNDVVTLTAHPNVGYKIWRWTGGGTILGYHETVNHTVTGTITITAEFEVDTTPYDVVLTADPAEGGVLTGGGTYVYNTEVTVSATANPGYIFTHWTNTATNATVSTEATFTFNVTPYERELTAHFLLSSVTQVNVLEAGWHWYSSYIEFDENSLSTIEEALLANGKIFKSQLDGYVVNDGGWNGSLEVLDNSKMYMIQMNADDELSLEGSVANPADHAIELFSGWNWIGYPVNATIDLLTALAGMTPSENDIIKGQNAFANFEEGEWSGSLTELIPGNGYMYKSLNNTMVSFTFPDGAGKSVVPAEKAETYWHGNMYRFANNITMVVSIDANLFNLTEGSHEIGAFAKGECRGAARLTYSERYNRYIAFLTVCGDDGETINFSLYDVNSDQFRGHAEESILFHHDDVYGSLKQPYMLHFAGTGMGENDAMMQVYPNPTHNKVMVSCKSMKQVRLVSVTGQTLLQQDVNCDEMQLNLEGFAAGLYLMQVTTLDGTSILKKVEIQK